MDRDGFTPELRGRLFAAVTGRGGDVTGTGSVADMLRATYGETRRGGVNTRAAAENLGVSQRTVQRWIAGANRPSAAHQRDITGNARRTATTQRGRRAALSGPRRSSLSRNGARLNIAGAQGPSLDGKDYKRRRAVTLTLDPAAAQAMLDSYERRGDRGLVTWLEGYADEAYVSGWSFDSIDDITVDGLRDGQ